MEPVTVDLMIDPDSSAVVLLDPDAHESMADPHAHEPMAGPDAHEPMAGPGVLYIVVLVVVSFRPKALEQAGLELPPLLSPDPPEPTPDPVKDLV